MPPPHYPFCSPPLNFSQVGSILTSSSCCYLKLVHICPPIVSFSPPLHCFLKWDLHLSSTLSIRISSFELRLYRINSHLLLNVVLRVGFIFVFHSIYSHLLLQALLEWHSQLCSTDFILASSSHLRLNGILSCVPK